MDARDILTDAASRPLAAIRAVAELITPGNLNAHPGGHDNSIAWLLWHMGREIDVQVAHLAGTEELWTERGYAEQLGITEEGIGYGHTPAQARAGPAPPELRTHPSTTPPPPRRRCRSTSRASIHQRSARSSPPTGTRPSPAAPGSSALLTTPPSTRGRWVTHCRSHPDKASRGQ